ncbi:histone H3.3a-like [Rosa chinensis]|uniref:histone H3.3a-like n=1 Tax=Rosa chinensis TaxID=74649 RepID=UPI000D086870|nr:histone H3.3a-like [Rosa chinensis]
MASTKQIACQSTGRKAPGKHLATKLARKFAPTTTEVLRSLTEFALVLLLFVKSLSTTIVQSSRYVNCHSRDLFANIAHRNFPSGDCFQSKELLALQEAAEAYLACESV